MDPLGFIELMEAPDKAVDVGLCPSVWGLCDETPLTCDLPSVFQNLNNLVDVTHRDKTGCTRETNSVRERWFREKSTNKPFNICDTNNRKVSRAVNMHNNKNDHQGVDLYERLDKRLFKFEDIQKEIIDKRLYPKIEFPQPQHFQLAPMSDPILHGMREKPLSLRYNPRRGEFDNADYRGEELINVASDLNPHYFQYSLGESSVDACKTTGGTSVKKSKEDAKLQKSLQVTLVEIYRSRMRKNESRNQIIKDFGLINEKKAHSHYYKRIEASVGKGGLKHLIPCLRLLQHEAREQMIAKLEILNEKRIQLNRIIYYGTQHGISAKRELELYETLKRQREERRQRKPNILQYAPGRSAPSTSKRKKIKPLEIFYLPRYRDLTPVEADLCSSNNLTPETFLDAKDSLVADCKKKNGILLKTARALIRIDVNKTKKIFDLLMEEGRIWPLKK